MAAYARKKRSEDSQRSGLERLPGKSSLLLSDQNLSAKRSASTGLGQVFTPRAIFWMLIIAVLAFGLVFSFDNSQQQVSELPKPPPTSTVEKESEKTAVPQSIPELAKINSDSKRPDKEAFPTEPAVATLKEELHEATPQASPETKPQTKTDPKIRHQVRKGQTWGSIARQHKISVLDAHGLDDAMRELSKKESITKNLSVGQTLEFLLDEAKVLQKVTTSVGPGRTVLLERVSKGNFRGSLEVEHGESYDRVLMGAINKETRTFADAAQSSGASYDIVDDIVDLFSDRVSFRRDFRLGDAFTVIFRERVLADESVAHSGPVLAAMLEIQGERHVAIRFRGKDGKHRYFDAEGMHIANTFLRYPVKFSRITSQFSRSRFHPVLKRYRPHNGVDFAAPRGTAVRSVADGVITLAGWNGGAGKMVKIQHGSRYATSYLHLSSIRKGIRKGVRVKRGQAVGGVGSTGLATGPHLHYSFYDRGRYVDPMRIKLPRVENLNKGNKISSSYLKRAKETLDRYHRNPIATSVGKPVKMDGMQTTHRDIDESTSPTPNNHNARTG